jgi:beta-galactosidase GanA
MFIGWMLFAACAAGLSLAQNAAGTPHLQKQGNATQLVVDGKPFLITSGELSNNAASSLEGLDPVWPKIVASNLNTVLVAISWAQFEPQEGKFNYAELDGVIAKARENHLRLVILWFGCWKNGTSSYPPVWVKKDFARFPRIQINEGKTVSIVGPVETLSTFGEATADADAKAFAALMRHIKEVDGAEHTVLMMQVENEVGVLRDSRDRSPAANRAYAGQVPAELMSYLEAHKDNLIPEFREVWAANGYKKSGTWEQVFGPGKPASLELPVQTNI